MVQCARASRVSSTKISRADLLAARIAGLAEDVADEADVLLAILLQLVVVLQVVVAIGQAEAALEDVEDVLVRLLRVAVDVADDRIDQVELEEVREVPGEVGLGLERVDGVELRLERRDARAPRRAPRS